MEKSWPNHIKESINSSANRLGTVHSIVVKMKAFQFSTTRGGTAWPGHYIHVQAGERVGCFAYDSLGQSNVRKINAYYKTSRLALKHVSNVQTLKWNSSMLQQCIVQSTIQLARLSKTMDCSLNHCSLFAVQVMACFTVRLLMCHCLIVTNATPRI